MRDVVTELLPSLELLLGYLGQGLVMSSASDDEHQYPRGSDTATSNANVRRYVRSRMSNHLPLRPRAPMSPLHFELGPYTLKVLHAEQGTLPRPRTDKRRMFYAANDHGMFSLNIFAQSNDVVNVDSDEKQLEEGCLVLVWDSADGRTLTQAELFRVSLAEWPGDRINLLAATVVTLEGDLDEIRKSTDADEGREFKATGTHPNDGTPEPPLEDDEDEGRE